MQDLQLIGVHEDGEHLLLGGPGDERFQIPVNEALRAAVRRDRPHFGRQQIEAEGGLRPREVQALIRAGASSDEAASRAGWSIEKVHRYEGPILAEREHVAGLAQQARLRTHTGGSTGGSTPTLSERVADRLRTRDVVVTEASWDSWRSEGGPWTVVLTFAAGGRQRQASWSFDLADRTVSAVDDEARWLSEEVQEAKGPIPAARVRPAPGRSTTVYDVEAEGGMRASVRDERQDDPLDLMTAMRRRSSARDRRKSGARRASGGAPPVPAEMPAPEMDHPGHSQLSLDPDDEAADSSRVLPFDPVEPSPAQPSPAESSPTVTPPIAAEHDEVVRPDPAPAAALRQEVEAATSVQLSVTSQSPSRPAPMAREAREATEAAQQSPPQGTSGKGPKRPAREAARKTGRPSVPAWDEIMFGSRPGANRSSS